MNFFAHLVVAAERSRDEAFVFGAMLPDLGSMGRFSWTAIHDEGTRAGLRLHHETDRVFHSLDRFRGLMSSGQRRLSSLDLRRALARGLAHIAVELLLDGELSARLEDRRLFRQALTEVSARRSPDLLEQTPEDRARRARLHERLLDGVLPQAYAEPEFVAERIVGICHSRPRLALRGDIAPELSGRPDLSTRSPSKRTASSRTDHLVREVLAQLEAE